MKSALNRIGKSILKKIGRVRYVIVECEAGRTDNTLTLLSELIRRGWTRELRLVALSQDPKKLRGLKADHIEVLKRSPSRRELFARLRLRYIKLHAVLILDENTQITKEAPETLHVYLTHGSPLKSVRKYYQCTKDTDYMLNQSEFWRGINAEEFGIPADRLITLGYPRNDALFKKTDVKSLFPGLFQWIVAWYPTFRHHKSGTYREGAAIPVIHDPDYARLIDALAAKYKLLLLIKPHPAQDMSMIQELRLNNVRLIENRFFEEHGLEPYEFLGNMDALITDYSSVVFDYLLVGKPVAFTFEDIQQYSEKVGLAVDPGLLSPSGELLDTPEDFERFFADLTGGRDPHRAERERLTRLTNEYLDGASAARVADWLERRININELGGAR